RVVPIRLPVVTELDEEDGLGTIIPMTYAYEGGRYRYDAREFRGFRYGRQADVLGNTSEVWFLQDDVHKGKEEQSLHKSALGVRPDGRNVRGLVQRHPAHVDDDWERTRPDLHLVHLRRGVRHVRALDGCLGEDKEPLDRSHSRADVHEHLQPNRSRVPGTLG